MPEATQETTCGHTTGMGLGCVVFTLSLMYVIKIGMISTISMLSQCQNKYSV